METTRLFLRELTSEDALNLYKLNINTDVIRFTQDVDFESIESARKFLINYHHYSQYGVGRWAVIEKETREFVGWCGVKYSEEHDEYDIGFRFLKQHWNKGYATESAKYCLELAFTKFNITKVIGRANSKNHASLRVLKKIGMTYSRSTQIGNEDWEIYTLLNGAKHS